MAKYQFDHKLAEECARAFSVSTGLGCTVSDTDGMILYEHGYGCGTCSLCRAAGLSREHCIRAHIYGMTEAERFGGKYIYFCPLGLTCFVSPIIGEEGSAAKITVGPFLMVEVQDFIDCELTENLHLDDESKSEVTALLSDVPNVPPQKVQELSVLLFMAVGFMNNVSAENRLLEMERSDTLQGQISSYISELKSHETPPRYPFEKERQLLQAISHCDREGVHRHLRELLASLLANGGGNPEWLRQRAGELVVLISRAAAENGADEEQTLFFIQRCQKSIPALKNFHDLSIWLFDAAIGFLDGLFAYPDAKHANIIHRCIQYIGTNYAEPLTLEETAKTVCLSPDYLSRIFKQETGSTFNQYLTNVRITKAKELIRRSNLRLTDISLMVGYDDQSYFTKVFKRSVGVSPSKYVTNAAALRENTYHKEDRAPKNRGTRPPFP